jgi:hypothetical protein
LPTHQDARLTLLLLGAPAAAQLMGVVFLPLLVAYIIESRAKRAFLTRMALNGATRRQPNAGRRHDWVVYVSMFAACVLACDVLVDVVHRLMGVPATPQA